MQPLARTLLSFALTLALIVGGIALDDATHAGGTIALLFMIGATITGVLCLAHCMALIAPTPINRPRQ